MKKILAIVLLCLTSSLTAQNTLGLNFQTFLPTGELKKDAPEIGGGGFAFEGIFRVKQSALYAGGLIEYNHFGSKVRQGYHGPDLEDVRVKRNFETLKFMGIFRFKPNCGEGIYPYFDLLLGGGNVFTRTNIREAFFDKAFESYLDMDQWVFMYGLGIGNEFLLSDFLILDVFVRTTKSARIDYLSPNSVQFNNSSNWYDLEVKSSAFEHINFGVGLKLYFDELISTL